MKINLVTLWCFNGFMTFVLKTFVMKTLVTTFLVTLHWLLQTVVTIFIFYWILGNGTYYFKT